MLGHSLIPKREVLLLARRWTPSIKWFDRLLQISAHIFVFSLLEQVIVRDFRALFALCAALRLLDELVLQILLLQRQDLPSLALIDFVVHLQRSTQIRIPYMWRLVRPRLPVRGHGRLLLAHPSIPLLRFPLPLQRLLLLEFLKLLMHLIELAGLIGLHALESSLGLVIVLAHINCIVVYY